MRCGYNIKKGDYMEIKRDIYLNRLIVRKHNGLIKVITGIRRCGKSYLMNNLFYNHLTGEGVDKNHIIRFAFDSAQDLLLIGEDLTELLRQKRKVDPAKFVNYISSQIKDGDAYYLLLDEIQELDGFETVLNGYLRNDNMDIYVTGSNSKFLSTDILTEFAGRGDEVHILPLSFSEFLPAYGGDTNIAFEEYMTYGGLPALLSLKTDEQKIAYLNTQLQTVYLQDVVKRNNLFSDRDIGELLDVLASCIGTLTNPAKLADTFRSVKRSTIAPSTVSKYIDCLQEAFMVKKALRYDVKGKKYINTPYKVYFEDVGLRNARLNFRQTEETHIMENIIYNELRYRGYNVDVGAVESREYNGGKDVKKQLEIDFIANQGSKRYYIQSAYDIPTEEKRLQETRPFDKVGDSFKKIIVIGRDIKPRRNEKGYLTVGVSEFLLNPDSLDL